MLTDRVPRRSILPLQTPRLAIRALERRDVTALTTYRNDPDIARYQDWELPYTRDLAHELVDELDGITGPVAGRWVQLAIDAGAGLVGDLAVWLDEAGQLAMIGYTLAAEHQGHGYAVEAVDAVVDALFERLGVHRVAATLDPHNTASARVLERSGFRYEGRALAAARVRGGWSDDDRYAVLADEFRAWRTRSRHVPDEVELRPMSSADLPLVLTIRLHHSQYRSVPTVAEAIAVAEVAGREAGDGDGRTRAIVADGEIVGLATFIPGVDRGWRPSVVMIDRRHQGRGIGRRVRALLEPSWPATDSALG